MKVEFKEGFKIELIAETDLEQIFMSEWEKRAVSEVTDNRDRDFRFVDPDYIDWRVG